MLERTYPRMQRFVAARLSPQGEFGLHLTAGILLMLLATWAFSFIADEVAEGAAITALDLQLANWLHSHASVGLTRFMLLITYLHSVPGVAALTLLLGWWLYRQRERDWLLALAVSMPGAMLLNVLLKQVFQRPRPYFADALLTLDTYSFPSGHTVSATVLYGFLACYGATHARTRTGAVLAIVGAVLMVALVGMSRMYLGVHYLSDVLGASAEGCAWLAVCITAVSTLRRRRAARSPP
jgi:membrane-associated phospholipid phosphatase